MTLDIIGLAGKHDAAGAIRNTDHGHVGFNYDFEALNADGKSNELNEAFTTLFSESQTLSVLSVLQSRIPILRLIVSTRGITVCRTLTPAAHLTAH